jgi:hypothetical protein
MTAIRRGAARGRREGDARAKKKRRHKRRRRASERALKGFICGGINKNLRAIYRGPSAARSGGSINLLRGARLARELQNRRPSSLYEARID